MKLNPNGYNITRGGTTVGIIFGIWCGGLAAFAFLSGEEMFIPGIFFTAVAAVFLVGGILSDFTLNRKAKKRIAHREQLLSCTCVSGRITGEDKYALVMGKKRRGNINSYKGARKNYIFTVAFTDPYTGEEREVTSEEYNFFMLHEKVEGKLKLARCFDGEYADVYVSPDGEAWVELKYRNVNEQ